MGRKSSYAWVVKVLNDKFVKSALVSGRALQESQTCGEIVAIMATSVSNSHVKELNQIFDMVLIKDIDWSTCYAEDDEDYAFLAAETLLRLRNLTTFSKMVVIHPEVTVIRQSDYLLDLLETGKEFLMRDNIGKIVGAGIRPGGNMAEGCADLRSKNWGTVSVTNLDTTAWNKRLEGLPDLVRISAADLERFELRINPKLSRDESDFRKSWIAVIGMACRFPGANSPEEYWDVLKNGWNMCGTLPDSRAQFCEGIGRSALGNFLKCRIDEFDAALFGMSPHEATFTDPQARLLLEVSWEAFADARYNPEKLRSTPTAVFHGSWLQDYKECLNAAKGEKTSKDDFMRKYLGNGFGSTAAKLSFFYGFTGENVATESGCSSSMVAVNMACQSLQRRDCSLSLVTGANVILQMDEKQKVLWAQDGKCKAFDESADGYARGEGVAVLILKRYSDALLDNDRIHGIILGGATSQEGLSKNFGTPTVESEERVMRMALAKSGVDPSEVDYVEAHATGTKLGDPIEAAAICKAYHSSRNRSQPLVIGSSKTNIGHTESVSGLAGIIKVLLAFKNEAIPPHLLLKQLNPQVSFDSIPGRVPTEIIPWPRRDNGEGHSHPRIAGVSSFGITGTDVHLILREPPVVLSSEEPDMKNKKGATYFPEILAFSAASTATLDQLKALYVRHATQANLSDMAFTVNTCRAHNLGYRNALLISQSTIKVIQEFKSDTSKRHSRPKLCFTFPGVIGSMEFASARLLYATCSTFKFDMDRCNGIWTSKISSSTSLLTILEKNWTGNESKPYGWYACVFSIQYSLSKLWMSWGVQPDMVLGQCMGEVTAAVVSGALFIEDAFKILKTSEYLVESNKIQPGSMMALNCDLRTCQQLIQNLHLTNRICIDVALVNSPSQTVVASSPENLTLLGEVCCRKEIKYHQLHVDYAAHSQLVDEACRKTEKDIYCNIQHAKLSIPYVSSVKGGIITKEDLDSRHWFKMSRHQVQFMQACHTAKQLGCNIFIEIGLGAALTKLTMENLGPSTDIICLASLMKSKGEIMCLESLINGLAQLYASGVDIDWENFYKKSSFKRKKVSLPHYPFQRKSYWFEKQIPNPKSTVNAGGKGESLPDNGMHPLIGFAVPNCTENIIFNCWINKSRVPYIYEHLIGDHVVFPGAGFMEMIMAALNTVVNDSDKTTALNDFKIYSPLVLNEDGKLLQTLLRKDEKNVDEDNRIVQVYAKHQDDDQWSLHASANVVIFNNDEISMEAFPPVEFISSENSKVECKLFYEILATSGLRFGPKFKSLLETQRNESGTLIKIEIPDNMEKYLCHPLLIDAMVQGVILHEGLFENNKLQVPVKIGSFMARMDIIKYVNRSSQLFVSIKTLQNGKTSGVNLLTNEGTVIAFMKNVIFATTNVDSVLKAAARTSAKNIPVPTYIYDIIWQPSKFYQPASKTNCSETGSILESVAFQKLQQDFFLRNMYTLDEQQFDEDMNELCKFYVLNAFYKLGWEPIGGNVLNLEKLSSQLGILPALIPAFKHFVSYLSEDNLLEQQKCEEYLVHSNFPPPDEVQRKIILGESKFTNYPAMETIHSCGTQLASILQGHVTGQHVLFANTNKAGTSNLAEHYYRTGRFGTVFHELVKLFACMSLELSWKTLDEPLKILEIGAGTGSFTKFVIPKLLEQGVKFQYYFTDISQSFLGKAAKNFHNNLDHFVFKTLNIEEDPLLQGGFPAAYFDIVVAVDVLHATRNLLKTIKNMESITKNGGRLLCLETEKPTREVDICFGILEGYWLFEDEIRENHCTIPATKWLQLFAKFGFTADSCAMYACNNQVSLITARLIKPVIKVTEGRKVIGAKKWLIFHDFSSNVNIPSSLENLMAKISQLGRCTSLVSYRDICDKETFENILKQYHPPDLEGILYIYGNSIGQHDSPKNIVEPLLLLSKHLGLFHKSLPRLHLVTRGCWKTFEKDNVLPSRDISCNNLSGLLWGFMRTFRVEMPGIISKSIDIDEEGNHWSDHLIHELWLNDKETEVCYRNCLRVCRRLNPVKHDNPSRVKIPVTMENPQFTVEFPESKVLSDVKYAIRKFATELREDEVEIEMRCSALNFKDVLTIIGPNRVFNEMKMLGLDYSGIITKVGSGVTDWKAGDCVFGCNFKERIVVSHTRTDRDWLIKMPKNITFSEAASLPTIFITAWHCIVNIGGLKPGNTILIHAAAGGVGLIAIQIAKYLGVNIIGTAGSQRKKDYLKTLGVNLIFNSRFVDFRDSIRKAFDGTLHPVDMVLNSLTGPGFKEASLDLVRNGGHFVEISKLDIWREEEVKKLRPLVNYKVVDVMQFDIILYKELMQKLTELLDCGEIKPLPCSMYRADEIVLALQSLQKAKHIGKVILDMPYCRITGLETKLMLKYRLFNDRSTYFISGGTGAMGMAISKWMISQGAKYLVLGNRSPLTDSQKDVINDLERDTNCRIIFHQVDISEYSQGKQLLECIAQDKDLPPLRGIHHCAGALCDQLISNLTWENFDKVLNGKVHGAWNLHVLTTAMNVSLEFFIFHSSMCATFGNIGQSNYTAANVYMDSLAEIRRNVGLPAISINWGKWKLGLAENTKVDLLVPFAVEKGIQMLEHVMTSQRNTSGKGLFAAGVFNGKRLVKMAPYFGKTLLEHVPYMSKMKNFPTQKVIDPTTDQSTECLKTDKSPSKLKEADWKRLSSEERSALVYECVVKILCETLGVSENEMEENAVFSDMGMDSLMSIEFTNKLLLEIGEDFSRNVIDVEKNNTIPSICQSLTNILEEKAST